MESVSSLSSVIGGYFPSESAQLTTDVLANLTALNLTDVYAFQFGNTTTSASKRSSRECKVLPGDKSWPSTITWLVLDLLTGGALIEGRPSAAVCYKDWPEYNAAKCAAVTTNWTSPEYQ